MKNVAIALLACLTIMVSGMSCLDTGTRSQTTSSSISTTQAEPQTPIELLDYATGYYNGAPMIITKWKNISSSDIAPDPHKSLKIKAAFFNGDEEIAQNFTYLHSSSDTPFERETSRQVYISSNVSYRWGSLSKNNIICKVYINDKFYKEFSIESKELYSNRIQ